MVEDQVWRIQVVLGNPAEVFLKRANLKILRASHFVCFFSGGQVDGYM